MVFASKLTQRAEAWAFWDGVHELNMVLGLWKSRFEFEYKRSFCFGDKIACYRVRLANRQE
ncbi:hypothetical protein GBA52_001399 [Prunus armeniaca]|nr:hypothetical protein GBA52_001399 [Prunus armeniaca]